MKSPPKRSAPGREIKGRASDVKSVAATVAHQIPPPVPKTSATAKAGTKERHSYKPLRKEFQRPGLNYREIAREGNAALYEQSWLGSSSPSISYEVIGIRRREGFQIDGRFVEPAEVYPRSELWGVDGFTFTNRNEAFAKLSEISLEEPAKTRREVN